jgi:multiple sugar transport system permease protein
MNETAEETAVDLVNLTAADATSNPVSVTGAASRTRARRSWRHAPLSWAREGGLTTLLFALPMLVVFGLFSWYPIVRLVVMSFQHTNLFTTSWVGFDNFRNVWNDPLFFKAVKNTAYFALLALVFGFPVPLVAAVLVSEIRRRRGLYSALAYLPVVIPPVVAVLLWYQFYDGGPTGLFNAILGWVHLGPYHWLSSEHLAMPALVVESTWANAGATMIIYLAALVSVSPDLYEAASVDGASVLRKIWSVTLPQLRGVMLLMLMLQIIGTAQVFIEPFLFTHGGPNNATMTVLLLIYDYAFGNSLGASFGNAAALSLMLAAFLVVFAVVFLRVTRSWSST